MSGQLAVRVYGAWPGEGLIVSGGDDGAVRLWDPRTPGDPGRELGRHDRAVPAVAVTGEGQLTVATVTGITMFDLITASSPAGPPS
jgi:WD40 repeat protein